MIELNELKFDFTGCNDIGLEIVMGALTVSERHNAQLLLKVEELETELQQYKTYVADITTVIQKNICKDFCPNLQSLERVVK